MSINSDFDCHICLETCAHPVITMCGHLFCWPCLSQWLEQGKPICPVCKAYVSRDNLVPIYGRGRSNPHALMNNTPDRPRGIRRTLDANGDVQERMISYFPSLFTLLFQTRTLTDIGTGSVVEIANGISKKESRFRIAMIILIFICFCLFLLL